MCILSLIVHTTIITNISECDKREDCDSPKQILCPFTDEQVLNGFIFGINTSEREFKNLDQLMSDPLKYGIVAKCFVTCRKPASDVN